MHELASDIAKLQALLDRSHKSAGEHLKKVFQAQLTAEEVVAELGGIFEMHLATTTPRGAPFVAPIDALFFRGDVWFGIPARAVRAPFVRRDPRVSCSYTRGESFAFIVHGRAVEVHENDSLAAAYANYSDSEYTKLYGEKWLAWRDHQLATSGRGDLWRVEAHSMFVKC